MLNFVRYLATKDCDYTCMLVVDSIPTFREWLSGCYTDGEALSPANHQTRILIGISEVSRLIAVLVEIIILNVKGVKRNGSTS